MKRWLTICFALFWQAMAMAQLTNGGFEELGSDRFPIGWEQFASEKESSVVRVTTDAFEGRFALYMEARTTATVGVNRSYRAGKPGEVVSDIGAMLPVKRGALVFRFKVVKATSDNIRVYAIPMKSDNLEGGAPRATYIVPPKFSGDNKWHIGVLAFDFSDKPEVRSVQIGLRINEGGQPAPAAVIFDDFRFVEKAGWHLRLDNIGFEEGEKPGEEGYFTLRLQNTGDEPAPVNASLSAPQKFVVEPAEIPQTVAPKDIATLKWFVKGLRRIGTKFSVHWEATPQEVESISHVCLPKLRIHSFGFANAVLFRDVPTNLKLVLENDGDAVIEGAAVELLLKGLKLKQGSVRTDLKSIPPKRTTVSWTVQGSSLTLCSALIQLKVGQGMVTTTTTAVVSQTIGERIKGTLTVSTGKVRLLFPSNPFGYGVFAVEVHDGKKWRRMALSPQLLTITYLDARRQVVTRSVYAPKGERLPNGGLMFPFQFQDELDGGVWKGEVKVEPDGNAVKFSFQLTTTRTRQILSVRIPELFVGDQTFGSNKTMALLPGVYWLLADETVDDARYSDPPHHLHIVPHPYKLAQPMMVVSHERAFVGLIWDALQQWCEGEGQGAETGLCPQPIFAVPNILTDQNNHLLALMVPNVPKWVKENSVWAQTPFTLSTNQTLKLQAWIIGGVGEVLDAYDEYFAKFPLPPVPDRPYPDEETFKRSRVGVRSDRYGKLFGGFQTLERQAIEDARAQRDDGSWGFVLDKGWTLEMLRKFAPNRPLSEYGSEGDTTVGTCTFLLRRAIALLRYARMTGSTKAAELGLKAIHFIDKNFVRPEGAQTWEVPLHCPDVLAAANAIHAYLEAWQVTGDRYWLERAIYWAKSGLPFIYLWNPPDRQTMMRYASIPVFGTSFFSAAPWFGTPVQWNGLDYAYALLKLANALRQFSVRDAWSCEFWRQVAEGITVCGIQHQAAVNHPDGNYPDSVALTYRYGPNDKGIINPHGIARNLWLLRDPSDDAWGYETAVIQTNPKIRITSDVVVERASWNDGELEFVLRAPKGVPNSQTIIACVTKPKQVFVNDRPLNSFRYDSRRKLLMLSVSHESEKVAVKVTGVHPETYESLGVLWEKPVWEFDIDNDPDDWTPAHDLEPLEVKGGILRTRSTGIDPYMHSPVVRVEAEKFKTLVLRLRVQFPEGTSPVGQVFWVREDDQNWSESKSVRFPLPTDGQWHEVKVDLTQSPEWRGVITQLRFDPGSGVGIVLELDFVRLE